VITRPVSTRIVISSKRSSRVINEISPAGIEARVCLGCYNNSRRLADATVVKEEEASAVEIVRSPSKELAPGGTLLSIPTDWNWSTF
jgi:hypothetical protein